MKKAVVAICAAFVLLFAFSFVPKAEVKREVAVENVVAPANASESGALGARFLNMLNHSFIYNEQFDNIEDMINGSVPALLNLREGDFIAEYHVEDYIFNMYGIEIIDMSGLNAEFPQKSGYLYIIPRGFDAFRHEMISVSENEDGTYTVITTAQIDTHMGESEKVTVKSMFIENEESDFGYNILYSEIY